MKSLLLLTLLISFPTFYAFQDGRLRSSKSDDKTVRGAIQIDEEFSKAILNDDADIFKRLITDDFTGISYSGQPLNKDKWIEGLKSSVSRYVSYTPHDVSARLYGDTAVVTGRIAATWQYQNQEASGWFSYTRVYVWQQNRWQLVAAQTNRIEEFGSASLAKVDSTTLSKTAARVKSKFFTIDLQRCRISGTTVTCDLSVTNDESFERVFKFYEGGYPSVMFDEQGNESRATQNQIANRGLRRGSAYFRRSNQSKSKLRWSLASSKYDKTTYFMV